MAAKRRRTSSNGLSEQDPVVSPAGAPKRPGKRPRIIFRRQIASTDEGQVFEVQYGIRRCVIKVWYHYEEWSDVKYLAERDPYRCEFRAYEAMYAAGLHKRGFIPEYIGTIPDMDPAKYTPWLNEFLLEDDHPSAILLEYIPNLQKLRPDIFDEDLKRKFRAAFDMIHKTGVIQGGVQARHLCIQKGTNKPVILDFDCAQCCTAVRPPAWYQRLLEKENARVHELLELMEQDSKIGLIDKSIGWFYTGGELDDPRAFWEEPDNAYFLREWAIPVS